MELIILKFLWKNSMKYFPYQKPPQPCKLESLEQILSGSHHSPYSIIETLLSMGKIIPPHHICLTKIVSEYDLEIPQSQTADKPMAPRGRATQQ